MNRKANQLIEAADGLLGPLVWRLGADEVRARRLRCFDNICALVGTVPCYRLGLSLTGRFWEHIEQVLDDQGSTDL